jgi:hypothetical protein
MKAFATGATGLPGNNPYLPVALKRFVRAGSPAAAILLPAGFFLAIAAVTLGVGLLRSHPRRDG